MRALAYLRVEVGRIFRTPLAWAILILTVCTPLLGHQWPIFAAGGTMNADFIANPVLACGLVGGLLYGVLTALQLDKVHQSKVSVLTDAIVSPVTMGFCRTAAVAVSALCAIAMAALLHLPYTMAQVGRVFDMSLYLGAYFILALPTLLFSILIVSAAYHIAGRVDVSVVVLIVAMLASSQTPRSSGSQNRRL